jgi:two-component system response regulator YesN
MILKAKRYIDENYSKPGLSLHTVASFVNVSPNHFSTVFSQEAGESFIEYLTCVRIDRAKQLLLSTQMKSADIAYSVGFNDPHYFSFIFKKNAGVTPRDFRAEKNAQDE